MKTKKFLSFLGLVLIVGVLTWAGLLYKTYGKQTLLFLFSSPKELLTYTSALVDTAPPSGNKLENGELVRPRASMAPIPERHALPKMSHVYQKLNNCGPSSALMAASTLDVTFDQPYAASILKGGPGDKNVGPLELVQFLETQGLHVAYRLNGDQETVARLISKDIPVIVEQWLVKRGSDELVGHYRVVKGYDQKSKVFTTNDSFNGPNFVIPYSQFDEWWRPFNRTYLVVYKPEQEQTVKEILGSDWDERLNAADAVAVAQSESKTIGDGYSYFNLGSALTHLHKYDEAKKAYDVALTKTFPPYFLWYQFGPLETYYQVGEYDRVISITDELFRAAGDAEEGHYYRRLVYEKQGKTDEAKSEQEKTLAANPRFIPPFK
jgi:tetratricopeptide (TPR) repeat protein